MASLAEDPPLVIKRGALVLTQEPLQIWWNDRPVELSPHETALLALLIRQGRVAWESLAHIGVDKRCREVFLFRIRRKFAALGAADPVETRRGWGLRLRIEPDPAGSTTTWIGARETSAVIALREPRRLPDAMVARLG